MHETAWSFSLCAAKSAGLRYQPATWQTAAEPINGKVEPADTCRESVKPIVALQRNGYAREVMVTEELP